MTAERLQTSDFDYRLPTDLIAQKPSSDRGGSRLLVVRRTAGNETALDDAQFADLPRLIPPGDLLVLNTTRVRHARLLGTPAIRRTSEILLIQPGPAGTWIAMGKPGARSGPANGCTRARRSDRDGGSPRRWKSAGALFGTVRRGSHDPLRTVAASPLYRAGCRSGRRVRYQTVYAQEEGSVAAPTAGLHFTPALLRSLREAGVLIEGLDLQVGPGTFKPVEVDDPERHQMHPERYDIGPQLASARRPGAGAGGRVWAVGTTVVRALESAALPDGTLQAGVPKPGS